MPVLLSFIEQNCVSKMKERDIIIVEVIMHNTVINDKLLGQLAVSSIIVELKSFDELMLAVSVPFKGLNDWHTSLVSL